MSLFLGSPDNALNEPNTIVITESFASKVFWKGESDGRGIDHQ